MVEAYVRKPNFIDTRTMTTISPSYIFDGIIDEDRARLAVQKLGEHWPEVAETLRNDENGNFWLDVPSSKDARVEFEVKHFSSTLSESFPLTRHTSTLSIQPYHSLSTTLGTRPYGDFKEFSSSLPNKTFRFYLSQFTDVSVLSLFYAHIACDGAAHQDILRNWVTLINDPEAKIQELWRGPDPIESIVEEAKARGDDEEIPDTAPWLSFPIEGMQAKFMKSFIEEYGQLEWRRVYFPGDMIRHLKEEALQELRLIEGKEDVRLSENDILSAWLWKNLGFSPDDDPTRSSCYQNMLDFRPRLPSLQNEVVHFTNAWSCIGTDASNTVGVIRSSSIAQVAKIVRRFTDKQATRESVERHVRWLSQVKEKGGRFVVPYQPGAKEFWATSWVAFKATDLRIEPSALKSGTSGTGNCIDFYSGLSVIPFPRAYILWKDPSGGYVVDASIGINRWNEPGLAKYEIKTEFNVDEVPKAQGYGVKK